MRPCPLVVKKSNQYYKYSPFRLGVDNIYSKNVVDLLFRPKAKTSYKTYITLGKVSIKNNTRYGMFADFPNFFLEKKMFFPKEILKMIRIV